MHVVVLGAGLLGVTSAYYLQYLGHDVTVVDRHGAPASHGAAIAAIAAGGPTAARSSRRWSRAGHWLRGGVQRLRRTLLLGSQFDPVNQMAELSRFSREILRELQHDAGMEDTDAWRREPATMDFYTSRRAFARTVRRHRRSAALAADRALLSADEAVRLEPALAPARARLAGATLGLQPEPGEPGRFADDLVQLCRSGGVRFLTGHTLVSLHQTDGRIDCVEAIDPAGRLRLLRADAYVLALGQDSASAAASAGIELPLVPARDYVVTLPVKDARKAQTLALNDHDARLQFRRVRRTDGTDCVRVSGTVAGLPHEPADADARRFATMVRRAEALFPGATDPLAARFQSATRQSGRNNLPLIGKTRLPNLFLNVSSGPMRWVNACGAGKSVAWIVSGLRPPVDFTFTQA